MLLTFSRSHSRVVVRVGVSKKVRMWMESEKHHKKLFQKGILHIESTFVSSGHVIVPCNGRGKRIDTQK